MRLPGGELWPVPVTLDVRPGLRRQDRPRLANRAARSRRAPPCGARRLRHLGSRQAWRGGTGVWHHVLSSSGCAVPPASGSGKSTWVAASPASRPQRTTTTRSCATHRSNCADISSVSAGRRIIGFQHESADTQARTRDDALRGARSTGPPAPAPGGRGHDAPRSEPLRAHQVLSGNREALPPPHRGVVAAAARNARRRATRSVVARDHPAELRLHRFHRGT